MGYLVDQVSLEELDEVEDRPPLSALVIGTDEGMPSAGFWSLLRELGIEVPVSDIDRSAFLVKGVRVGMSVLNGTRAQPSGDAEL